MGTNIPHLREPGVVINAYIEDNYEVRANALFQPWDKESDLDAGLLGVPYDGASVVRNGSREAPNRIRQSFSYNTSYSPDFDVDIDELMLADLGDVDIDLMDLETTRRRTKAVLDAVHDRDIVPVVLGGDHSTSYATVAAACARDDVDSLGVVQFDAHQDLRHSHEGQPSSGVQFRELLEDDRYPEFTGENYAQVGIRGFMNSRYYMDYAEEKDITVITGHEVAEDGIESAVEQALTVAGEGTDAIFMTVDIDCLDLSIAPGTAAPSPGGLSSWDILKGVYRVGAHEKTIGMDLVEVSPPNDVQGITSVTAATIVLHFLGGLTSSHGTE